ncbi:hypothetical protein RV10_GL004930 [Enterococcus pallens]|nr:hypothetical protein RV10_GL004930 [Enterococcus pallens]
MYSKPNVTNVKNLKDIYDKFLSGETGNSLYSGDNSVLLRGEAGVYSDPIASVNRLRDPNFLKIIQEYHGEIGADISTLEENNFLFYSQHHGLPTPLLDTTEILNTALYFATNEDGQGEQGQLHVFDKRLCIDISSIPHKGFWDIDIEKEYLSMLANKGSELFSLMFNGLERARQQDKSINSILNVWNNDLIKYISDFPVIDMMDDAPKHMKNDVVYQNYMEVAKLLNTKYIEGDYLKETQSIEDFIHEGLSDVYTHVWDEEDPSYDYDDQFPKLLHYETEQTLVDVLFAKYLSLNNSYISFYEMGGEVQKQIKQDSVFKYFCLLDIALFVLGRSIYVNRTSEYLPHLPYLLVNPSVKFGRIKAQQGNFLYQISAKYNYINNDKNTKYTARVIQKIVSNERILIENKETVLKELDYMGINRGTIYLDPDNIAKHITSKYK